MIRFLCPNCQKRLKAPDKGAGRKTHCPRCGQRMYVPPPVRSDEQHKTVVEQTVPSLSEWVEDVRETEEGTLPSPQQLSGQILFECPTCRCPLNVAEQMLGRMVECPKCRTSFAALKEDPVSSVAQTKVPAPNTPVPALQHDVEPTRNRFRKRVRPTTGSGSTLLGVLFVVVGVLFAGVGFLMLTYYWLGYDTSVPVNSYSIFYSGERVHNIGLMQNRLIGVIVGGGSFVVGLALYVVGLIVSPNQTRKWLLIATGLIMLVPLLFGVLAALRA